MTKPTGGATPSRNTAARNNYAMPNTPIASAKRPRSSMDKSAMKSPGVAQKTFGLPSTPLVNRYAESSGLDGSPEAANNKVLSPMHPPTRTQIIQEELREEGGEVGEGSQGPLKVVDAIFSPMLKFLSGQEGEGAEGDEERGALEELTENDEVDNDAKLSISGSNGLSSSHKTVSREDEEEDLAVNEDEQPLEEQEDAILVEADDASSQGSEDEEEDEFNPYAFIKSLPNYEDVKSLSPPNPVLPPKDNDAPPISLVLDLDETLVHCTTEEVDDADLTFPVEFHGMTYQVYVRLRPHLTKFLESVSKNFEVIVFTASQRVYADALLDLIDPGKRRFNS